MTAQKRTQRLERAGISNRKFWEDDLEMGVDSILRSAENDGFSEKWIGERTGRQVTTLCRCLGIKADGSTQKKKEALRDANDGLLPYFLVEQFAKFKSKVAIIDLSKGILTKVALEVCRKDGEEDFDTPALVFALYERRAGGNLQLVFHFDKIHKTGFARMHMKGNGTAARPFAGRHSAAEAARESPRRLRPPEAGRKEERTEGGDPPRRPFPRVHPPRGKARSHPRE